MLFGSLTVTESGIFGLPSTLLACLPVISAVIALIGGIIAFNQSKWGALLFFIAVGLCVPARDTWLYGGLYVFAGLLCFFLKGRNYDSEYAYDYDDEGDAYYETSENDNGYDFPQVQPVQPQVQPVTEEQDPLGGDVAVNEAVQFNIEPPKVRRRLSKTCPKCGQVVSRESHYCPTCGEKLHVVPDTLNFTISGRDDDTDIEQLNNQLLTPKEPEENYDNDSIEDDKITEDQSAETSEYAEETESKEEMANYRVLVKPDRNNQEYAGRNARRSTGREAASTYQEFSHYAKHGKKRSRSFGRRALSIVLLISAVGGALYFLLGLRKLPPGDLPPIAKTEIVRETEQVPVNPPVEPEVKKNEVVAEPVSVAVAENVLPNFEPEKLPKNGIITGSSVNVRADHTTSSSRVTRLKVNTRVEILGTFNVPSGQYSGIWYNIRTGNNEGWVYGRYVQPVGGGLPSGYSSALLKTFGSSKQQLIEALGNPTRSTGSSAEWPGLTATLKGDEITRVRLTSSNRELQNGLKTGMSQTAMLQIMGYPSSVNGRTMNYNEGGKTGLTIQLDKNNAITSITVNEI